MEKTRKLLESSELYRKIDALPMSITDRSRAKAVLSKANMVFDLVFGALSLLGFSAPLKTAPKLKHQ